MCEQALSSGRRPQLSPVACWLLAVAVGASPGAAKPTGEDETAKTAASTRPPPASNPLAGLPSKPGPHVELIRGMGPDTWLKLGPPAADPQWGRARGRSWTPKMAYAADLRVAWLYGSGQHGFVKPDGHYPDDLWAYDVNAHRWICVWPGTDVKRVRLRLDSRGFEVNQKGEPIPVAQIGHGYQNVAYVASLKKFMSIQSDDPYTSRAIPQRRQWHPPGASNYRMGGSPKHPWFYDVSLGKWERPYVEGPGPGQRRESVLEDLPGRGQAFFLYHHGVVWLYDYTANRWTDARTPGPRPPFGIDPVACYDAKRQRIYACRSAELWAYDVRKNASLAPRPTGRPAAGEQGGGRDMTITYDIANDVVVLNVYRDSPQKRGIYIYDPAANTWNGKPRPIPKELVPRLNLNAFYDPERNVHVYHAAGDSEDNGVIWVYRYAPAAM